MQEKLSFFNNLGYYPSNGVNFSFENRSQKWCPIDWKQKTVLTSSTLSKKQ